MYDIVIIIQYLYLQSKRKKCNKSNQRFKQVWSSQNQIFFHNCNEMFYPRVFSLSIDSVSLLRHYVSNDIQLIRSEQTYRNVLSVSGVKTLFRNRMLETSVSPQRLWCTTESGVQRGGYLMNLMTGKITHLYSVSVTVARADSGHFGVTDRVRKIVGVDSVRR